MENAVNIEEYEPSQEELDLMAAKQLLLELKMIKNRIYTSNTLVNSMLIVQIKMILKGLMTKYNEAGMLKGEFVTLKLSNRSKHANIDFVYSQNLRILMSKVVEALPTPETSDKE